MLHPLIVQRLAWQRTIYVDSQYRATYDMRRRNRRQAFGRMILRWHAEGRSYQTIVS